MSQSLLDAAEQLAALLLIARPGCAVVERARQPCQFRTAAGVALVGAGRAETAGLALAQGEAQIHLRIGRQVRFQRAKQHLAAAFFVVAKTACIRHGCHHTPTQRSGLVERTAHIGLGTIGVPAARIDPHAGLELACGALAHHIDGGAIAALAHDQT